MWGVSGRGGSIVVVFHHTLSKSFDRMCGLRGGFFFARTGTLRYVVFGLTGARSHGFVNMDHDQYRHRAEVARGGCGEKRRRRGSAKA